MNKKNLFTACVLCSALLSTGSAYAENEHSYLSGVGSKLGQGFANTATGVVEIPKNIVNISHEQNIFVGADLGSVAWSHGNCRSNHCGCGGIDYGSDSYQRLSSHRLMYGIVLARIPVTLAGICQDSGRLTDRSMTANKPPLTH